MKKPDLEKQFIAWAIDINSSPGKALALCDPKGIALFLDGLGQSSIKASELELMMPGICSTLVGMECAPASAIVDRLK